MWQAKFSFDQMKKISQSAKNDSIERNSQINGNRQTRKTKRNKKENQEKAELDFYLRVVLPKERNKVLTNHSATLQLLFLSTKRQFLDRPRGNVQSQKTIDKLSVYELLNNVFLSQNFLAYVIIHCECYNLLLFWITMVKFSRRFKKGMNNMQQEKENKLAGKAN